MAKTKGLWRDPRTGILYVRRRVPDALKPAFACGDFYKVSLGTADPREAEKRLVTLDEAKSLVERHLPRR